MNLLEPLSRTEAVVDLLRTNLAGDFAAEAHQWAPTAPARAACNERTS